MKHITGSLWQTPNGRHNILIEGKVKSIACGLLTDEEALQLADELTTIATRITEHVQDCRVRRDKRRAS